MKNSLFKLAKGAAANTFVEDYTYQSNGVSTAGIYTTSSTTYDVAGYVLSRGDILGGKVPVYWGPAQPAVTDYATYTPPGYWPPQGTLPRTPNVCRLIWEDADLDGEAFAVAGFTGTYTYGIHVSSFDFDDISSQPQSVFSASTHTSYNYPFGSGTGIICYATAFNIVYAGFHDYGNGLTLTVTGDQKDWYLYDFLTPPFSLDDFRNPNGLTYLAIEEGWLLISTNFAPAPSNPGSADSAPPFISTTPDGPNAVGCTVYDTGRYSVDGVIYTDGTDVEIPPQPLVIFQGFKQPDFIDITKRFTNIQTACETLDTIYATSVYPYFDTFLKNGHQVDDFLSPVIPITNEWVPTNTVNILVLAKPRPLPASGVITLAKATYQAAMEAGTPYTCIIFVESQWMIDCNIPVSIVTDFTGAIASLCDSLGFVFAGDPMTGQDMNGVAFVATIQSLVNSYFPAPGPGSLDPPRTDHGNGSAGTRTPFSRQFALGSP
jgi:hypothetical protein